MAIPYSGDDSAWIDLSLLETTEQVIGGLDGSSNRPHKENADRSAYLKKLNDRMVGMVADFAMQAAPGGWLACDGAVVDRATYPDLFTAISFNYGRRFNENPSPDTFNIVDRADPAVLIAHGFTTEDAVNIKQLNPNSTAVIQNGVTVITPADTVYVRAIDALNFSLHPTAADATNDTNPLDAVSFDALNGFVIEYNDKFTLPDLRERLTKGISSATTDYQSAEAWLTPDGAATAYFTHSILKCVKYE